MNTRPEAKGSPRRLRPETDDSRSRRVCGHDETRPSTNVNAVRYPFDTAGETPIALIFVVWGILRAGSSCAIPQAG